VALSLSARKLQGKMGGAAVHEGVPLVATVRSVEDHGYLLHFGIKVCVCVCA
jgi:hypothetical protein